MLDEAVPIGNLPSTATLVNDAAFPGMFDGPSHELRVLMFDAHNLESRERHKTGFLVVDRGVSGLNRFSGGVEGDGGVGFWVELDDGCARGYYAVRGSYAAYEPAALHEGYLYKSVKGCGSFDPSRRSFDGLKGRFAVYLWNCHLIAHPGVDGEQEARLVDAYLDEVSPLVEAFQRVKDEESGRGKQFEQNKLAVLDRIHAKIRSANDRFKEDAGSLGLDCGYYIKLFSATVGEGSPPSAEVARAEAAVRAREAEAAARAKRAEAAKRAKRAKARDKFLKVLLSGCLNGCVWIVSIVLALMAVLGWLMILI